MRTRGLLLGLLVAVVAAAAVGAFALRATSPSTVTSAAPSGSRSAVAAAPVPAFSHVYLIVLENKDARRILAGSETPFLSSLASRYAVADAYQAVAHPSQPNYIALFSGSTQGIRDDGRHDIDAVNLADQLEAGRRTWRVFAENVRSGCDSSGRAAGGPDGPGTYARKHNPAISFRDISTKPARCANILDFSHFDPAAADFELIVPNLCHDMHDCSPAEGDKFLASFVPRILGSDAWKHDGVLFITFDESDNGSGPNQVATLVVAPGVMPGFRSSVAHTHYSLLRTIEQGLGVGCLAESCGANDLSEFFPR